MDDDRSIAPCVMMMMHTCHYNRPGDDQGNDANQSPMIDRYSGRGDVCRIMAPEKKSASQNPQTNGNDNDDGQHGVTHIELNHQQ